MLCFTKARLTNNKWEERETCNNQSEEVKVDLTGTDGKIGSYYFA